MSVIFSKLAGKNDPYIGKFEHPIKALIESESNSLEKKKTLLDVLYNVEKSKRYAETVMGQGDFGLFQSVKEGQGAENDAPEGGFKKTIEHIPFMKEFTITKEMLDDAKFGLPAEFRSRPKGFVRAYYRTRVKLGAWALANGTSASGVFNKSTVDLTTGDGLTLFNSAHKFSASDKFKGKTQSNYFYDDKLCGSSAKLETAISTLANKMRNFKDENGETLGYVPDIIVIPCNRPQLENDVKKVIGSERTTGTDYNDINTQYGNWTLVVLDGWETTDDRFMLMSSEANEQLMGNMFYNRVALDVKSEVDIHTRNLIYNGYCRMGIGFTTWKHILLAVQSSTTVSGATDLALA